MDPTPTAAPAATEYSSPRITIAHSAAVLGTLQAGDGSYVAQGAIVRSLEGGVSLGAGSALLENCVAVGSPALPTTVGRRSLFGHRCLIVGAHVGDLCEVGNGAILLPGSRLGHRCFLGEGTLIPPGASFPDDSVVVGRPGRLVRRASPADLERLTALRNGSLSLPPPHLLPFHAGLPAGVTMGKLYAYLDKQPLVAPTAFLFDSAEVTGDVHIGEYSLIGAGVKILGDSHGPVRIGARVQILENTVLHLLPDNELVIEDDVVIGPGAMIHGCHIGAGSVIEPGAIVCDWSRLGRHSLVRAGTLVKQRATFPERAVVEGFPGAQVDTLPAPPERPRWALQLEDLPSLTRVR